MRSDLARCAYACHQRCAEGGALGDFWDSVKSFVGSSAETLGKAVVQKGAMEITGQPGGVPTGYLPPPRPATSEWTKYVPWVLGGVGAVIVLKLVLNRGNKGRR